MEDTYQRTCPYKFQKKTIGAGSFGKVYKASYDSKTVAVKSIKLSSVSDIIDLEILRYITHPNIIEVLDVLTHDACQDTTHIGIVMPLAISSLFAWYQQYPPTKESVLSVMYQSADAVSWLHANHVWHLDIKPENFLVFGDVKNPIVKLTDFSLGTFVNRHASWIDSVDEKITITYRPPESMKPSAQSGTYIFYESADSYSLAVMWIELILRKYPFKFDGKRNIVTITPIPWNVIQKTYSANIVKLLQNMTHDSPLRRWNIVDAVKTLKNYNYHSGNIYQPIIYSSPDKPVLPKRVVEEFALSQKIKMKTYFRLLDLFFLTLPLLELTVDGLILVGDEVISTLSSKKKESAETHYLNALLLIARALSDDYARVQFYEPEPYFRTVTFLVKQFSGHFYRPVLYDTASNINDLIALELFVSDRDTYYSLKPEHNYTVNWVKNIPPEEWDFVTYQEFRSLVSQIK